MAHGGLKRPPLCNSRATERAEKCRIGTEWAGFGVSGNPYSIGLFSSGQVRPGRRTTFRIPMGLEICLILKGFSRHFRAPCDKCATAAPFSFLAGEFPEAVASALLATAAKQTASAEQRTRSTTDETTQDDASTPKAAATVHGFRREVVTKISGSSIERDREGDRAIPRGLLAHPSGTKVPDPRHCRALIQMLGGGERP